MSKKLLLLLALALLLGVTAFILWRTDKASAPVVTPVPVKNTETSNEDKPRFVTEVDPDVKNWETKETEFFIIKFPKEWYWLELSEKETGYRNMYIISNNSKFPLANYKNDPISLTGIQNSKLADTEIVINFGGTATANSGTPVDSLNFLTTSKDNPERKCVRPTDTKVLPFIASCTNKENDKIIQTYYIINEEISLFLNMYMSHETILSKSILEKIARNVKLK